MGVFDWLFGGKKKVSKKENAASIQQPKRQDVDFTDYFVVNTGVSHGIPSQLIQAPKTSKEVLETFQQHIQNVPALPAVWNEIQQSIARGDSAKHMAQIVRQDQGLATEVLKAPNSKGFANKREINDIGQAIVHLGFQAVRGIATNYGTASFSQEWRTPFSIQKLWKHSMAVSALTSITAKYIPGCNAGAASTLGLLHDIGRLGLNSMCQIPFHYPPKSEQGFLMYEHEHFECTHVDAGVLLAKHWQLPEGLQQGIEYHHHPGLGHMENIPEHIRKEVFAVYLADFLAIHFDISGGNKLLVEPHESFAPLLQVNLNSIAHDSHISKELWRIQSIDF